MRYIWIIRHGKSEQGHGKNDHDRALNDRGHADGLFMQSWLSSHAHQATWMWVSSALRAQQTAHYALTGFSQSNHSCTDVTAETLYLAPPQSILDCIQQTPEDVRSVAIVGHNPGLSHMVSLLNNNEAAGGDLFNLPTWGISLFATEADWIDVRYGGCQLLETASPKLLR